MKVEPKIKPELDPDFVPAALWNRAFRNKVSACDGPVNVSIAIEQPDKSCVVHDTQILPTTPANETLNLRYLERMLKFLLWQCGGSSIWITGCDALTEALSTIYSAKGIRHFDSNFFGEKVYRQPLQFHACSIDELKVPNEQSITLGRHLDGCRIGFDLGGSDRKCAAVIDGNVVFSEEIKWNPYFESDPEYHIAGIQDSLERAAAHLPRIDAIGGSAAGVYVNNEVRAASLFRGISPNDFETQIRRLFFDLKKRWNHIPFDVVNDGEVTALAGSMALNENAVLGLAMGTSEAVGYVTPEGRITPMLNELAFAPVDYRDDAPADEWSGDLGCGVQYFSQQAVARLAPLAGFNFPAELPFPELLINVQNAMAEGDKRAAAIYSTIGTYLGYSLAHYADFYEIRVLLLLGRVMSGEGGTLIIENARRVLAAEFPDLAEQITITTPDEKDKRHGQAVAAATLPSIGAES